MKNIHIDAVGKTFGGKAGDARFVALEDVNLDIKAGEFISLLGPSGCGKSTLLRCVAGLETPSTGSISVDDQPIRPGFDQVGLVFQSSNLLPWLSILDNVLYPVRVRSRSEVKNYYSRALELLDQVGLTHVKNQLPASLSGGMQQRAGIARGLIMDPDILLMDEPFSALDALTREDLQFELIRLHQETGKTFIFVTHAISEAIFLSSRIAVMQSFPGKIAETIDIDFDYPRMLDILSEDEAKTIDARIRKLVFDRPNARMTEV